jgi:hypothetical protein
MKKQLSSLVLLLSTILFFNHGFSQDIGSIFCWHYKEIYGGHDYPYNQSILKRNFPNHNTHWSANMQWWESIAEEIDYSGLDYIALLSRGNPPIEKDKGNGNPKYIPTLINALNARGANSIKIAIFDDMPNSWSGSKNWHDSNGTVNSSSNPKFDISDTTNYKYIWDYNLKQVYEHVPAERLYKIDDKPVIFFWNLKDTWFTNIEGNSAAILHYIREQCQSEFGFTPFLIVQSSWFDSDPQLQLSDVDAVHGWFSSHNQRSWTLFERNNYKIGVMVPGFYKEGRLLDPSMGTDDNGTMLRTGLDRTVGAGARTTLIEGFTNAAETAALWRSNDAGAYRFYDYPNQRLNIVRSYTTNPFPDVLKLEAEACDFHHDLTPGNSGGAYLHMGDLDVVKSNDIMGGWHVTDTEPGEWMEWRELPLLEKTKFELRYKSTATSSVKISVDGNDLPTASLPSTGGIWSTIDMGSMDLAENGYHTVRLTIVSGSPDINYFNRINEATVNSEVVLQAHLQNELHVYPNPATDFVRIVPNTENGEISLYSITGELQMRSVFETGQEIELNIAHLKPGLYFLRINNTSHKLIVK